MKKKSAFTLIELIVVISIIALISTVVFFSLSGSKQKEKDAKKLSEVLQLQTALENYKRAEGVYPSTITLGQPLIGSTTGITFMSKVPIAPTGETCAVSQYSYSYSTTTKEYSLFFCINNDLEDYTKGLKKLTPLGIRDFEYPILNSSNWVLGSGAITIAQHGGSTNFNLNGLTTENERVMGSDPWGNNVIVWETRPSGNSEADGGWNTGFTIPINSSKMYRFSVWVKRTTDDTSGYFYLGLYGANKFGTNIGVLPMVGETPNTNPYFCARLVSSIQKDKWYLIVGHAHPYNSTATTASIDSGIYDVIGNKVFPATDFKWQEGNTITYHRAYHYYSTISTPRLQFFDPRVYLVDGLEPSIKDMLNNYINY